MTAEAKKVDGKMNFIKQIIKKNQIKKLEKKEQVLWVDGKFITEDNITIELGIQLSFHINNINLFLDSLFMEDMEQGVKNIFIEIAKKEIKKVTLGDNWQDYFEKEAIYKEKHQRNLQYRMEERLSIYGVSVDKLELLLWKLPDELKDAWQKIKKAEAEREKIMQEREINGE